MKAKTIFFVIFVVIFSISVSAQNTKKTEKVSKPVGARVYSQAEFDSVKAELAVLDDNATVNVGLLRKVMTYLHDVTLRDGHKEYVSMNGKTLKSLKNNVGSIAELTAKLNESVTNVETVVAGDETPVTTNEVKIETTTKSASELAMEAIKKAVAARRAAQQK